MAERGRARPSQGGTTIATLPNLLGIARIAATPVLIALLLVPFRGAGVLAFAIFVVAAATDFLDGRLARARGQVSPLGVFMDLTADKVLVAGVLIAMVEAAVLPTWIVAVVLIRELVIQGVRQVAAAGDVVIAAGALGKAKTLTTLAAMALLLLAFDARTGGPMGGFELVASFLALSGFWLMVLATLLTVVSGLDYLRAALPLLLGRRSSV